jgi:hypothetical protein
MYERFTDRARKVMQFANEEAKRFKHEYIGTEHILLGLVKEGAGIAANVLRNLDIDLSKLRREVEKIIMAGPDMVTMGKLPQTPRAKKVIEYSLEEALNLGHNYVGTEHLLLGLAREQEGVASQVLMNVGVRLDDLREEVMNILGHTVAPAREHPEHRESLRGQSMESSELMVGFGHLPGELVQALEDINTWIEQIEVAKEEAVAVHDFIKAANLRDQADRIKRKVRDLVVNLRDLLGRSPDVPS